MLGSRSTGTVAGGAARGCWAKARVNSHAPVPTKHACIRHEVTRAPAQLRFMTHGSVTHESGDNQLLSEQANRVLCRFGCYLIERLLTQFGHECRSMQQERGLVLLPPFRYGRKIRAIGFD